MNNLIKYLIAPLFVTIIGGIAVSHYNSHRDNENNEDKDKTTKEENKPITKNIKNSTSNEQEQIKNKETKERDENHIKENNIKIIDEPQNKRSIDDFIFR